MRETRKGNAFYERNSWHHRIKILNEDYSTSYGKKGGFKTPEEAEESFKRYKEEYEAQLTAHHLNIVEDVHFSNYLIYWYENIFKEKEPENTYALGVAYVIYNMVVPLLRKEGARIDIKLRLISENYLDRLFAELAKITPSAGSKCQEVLSVALSDALINKYIMYNPINGTKKITRQQPKINILNKEELSKLLLFAQYDNWYVEILLAVFCGLRKGEIMGLKFEDFDFDENIIRIRRQLVSNPIISNDIDVNSIKIEKYVLTEKPPKKDSYRNLKVPKIIMEKIKERKEEYELYKKNVSDFKEYNYISFDKKTGKPHFPSSFNAYLSKLCTKINISQVSVHGLRHMFATILIERGVPIEKIAALLGHSSPNITFEIYCAIMEEREKILSFINNIFNPESIMGGVRK